MSSTTGSTTPLPEVRRVAVITHGRAETSGEALEQLARARARSRRRAALPDEEAAKHGDGGGADVADSRPRGRARRRRDDAAGAEALPRHRRARARRQLRPRRLPHVDRGGRARGGPRRAFAGEFELVELPTLEASAGGERWPAVNDIVVASSTLGRMIELGWAVGGEDLGSQPCDGLICSTPSGSTAYNLSNGGPVLVWGLDAMAITFVAPHSLHARPLVVPRGRALTVGEPDGGCGRDGARRRSAGARARARRSGRGAARGAAQPARDAAGEHVLQPLPAHVRLRVGIGTQSAPSRHTCVRFRRVAARGRPT